eukprot:5768762-Pleurochrysis_carterae.AAC.1
MQPASFKQACCSLFAKPSHKAIKDRTLSRKCYSSDPAARKSDVQVTARITSTTGEHLLKNSRP